MAMRVSVVTHLAMSVDSYSSCFSVVACLVEMLRIDIDVKKFRFFEEITTLFNDPPSFQVC